MSPTPLDKPGFISLLPSFLFFVAGIVASSKALANISVGMFLCLHNTLCSVLYLLEVFPSMRREGNISNPPPQLKAVAETSISRIGVLAALLTLLTALAAVISDLEINFSESPYLWLMVSLSCVAVQRLHSRIADARYTDVDRLYCCYVFSVVVLAPASLYLEEAFEVLHFPHASRLDFMGACLLVGVLALLLSLHTIKFQTHRHFSRVDAVGRLVTALVSVVVFTDETRQATAALLLTNLGLGLLVPGVRSISPDPADRWPAARPDLPDDTQTLLAVDTQS
ncbi:transmembrane protein 241 isoform X2 [Hyalella azteca]|nr:transmembrane protein 241 isoform X2 [Hyalella azteca]